MRILVCGGRDFEDRRQLYAELDKLQCDLLIAGGARGADRLAADWADMRQIAKKIFLADWENLGRSAGSLRNQRMIDEGRPDLVVAFPGGRGTADMVRRARVALIEVKEIGFLGEGKQV